MFKNINKQAKLCLKDLVDYRDGQIVSRTLVQNNFVSMTLFSFDKGEEISTHAAGGDAMVTVLEGTGRFTVGGDVFILTEGETLIMPKDIPHAVFGEERFKMQLIVSFCLPEAYCVRQSRLNFLSGMKEVSRVDTDVPRTKLPLPYFFRMMSAVFSILSCLSVCS